MEDAVVAKSRLRQVIFMGLKLFLTINIPKKWDFSKNCSGKNNNKVAWPKVFEFEISNLCNLECIMCNGYFSSAIRKNREKLPKLHSPYDDNFVEQLKPFLPHLTDAKFLGGEPFLIDLYYKIWDELIDNKYKARVHITTNGTVLTPKAKKYLEKMDASITVSVDSLEKENLEKIRKNTHYESFMENINWLFEYCKQKQTYILFSVCPMKSNAHELANIIRFCLKKNIRIHFNTVWYPEFESLRFASDSILDNLIIDLSSIDFDMADEVSKYNCKKNKDLISHLHFWKKESAKNADKYIKIIDTIKNINLFPNSYVNEIFSSLLTAYVPNHDIYAVSGESITDKIEQTNQQFEQLKNNWGSQTFLKTYFYCLELTAKQLLNNKEFHDFKSKLDALITQVEQKEKTDTIANTIIHKSTFFDSYHAICKTPIKELILLSEKI